MTAQEFADQFDVLYNNITSNQAPGLDNYEKSVFLTKAQDEILKSYFNPRLNKSAEGFDGNEKRQIDFSMVMKTKKYESSDFTTAILDNKSNTKRITIASNIMMFINEFADVTRGDNKTVRLVVVPLGYQELSRLSSKPYKRPVQYQAWRIIDNANSVNQVELIIGANDILTAYTIRYIKRPYPIILEKLDGVSIEGYTEPYNKAVSESVYEPAMDNSDPNNPVHKNIDGQPAYIKKSVTVNHACELDPILHEEILQRAVELAKAAYQGGLDSQIALGVNSETNIGYAGGGQQQRQ